MPIVGVQIRTTLSSTPLISPSAHLSLKAGFFPTLGKGVAHPMIMPHHCKSLTMLRSRRHSLCTPMRIYWSLFQSIQRDSTPPISQRTATSRSHGHKIYHGICSCQNEPRSTTSKYSHFLVRCREAQKVFYPTWGYPQIWWMRLNVLTLRSSTRHQSRDYTKRWPG